MATLSEADDLKEPLVETSYPCIKPDQLDESDDDFQYEEVDVGR
jgi:hypothetical protein